MIRRATADDADRIAALFRRSFRTLTFLPTLHTPDEDREHLREVIAEQEVWAWEEDGRILGFAALSTEGELTKLYVEPGENNRGIGSALLDRIKERRPAGFHLWTFQRNEGARRFYDRHGFRVVKLTDGSANEEKEPDVLYEWRPTPK